MSLYGNAISWSIDQKTRFLTVVSNDLRKWIGSLEEKASSLFRPDRLLEMVHKEDVHMFVEHMDILYSGQISSLEYRIHTDTGEMKWVHSIGVPVRDQDNMVIRIDGFLADITDRRLMQERYQRTYAMYERVLEKIDVAIWSYDCVSDHISFASEAITRITGYPLEKVTEPHFLQEQIYKEDLPLFEKVKAIVNQGLPDLSEYRIIHASGEIRWIQVRIIPGLDDANNVIRLDGAVMDITDRKAVEEALLRSEQRYKSLFEYNSDVVCELDLHGNVLAINPVAEKITEEELSIDKGSFSLKAFLGTEQTERLKNYYEQTLKGHTPQYSVTSCHKNDRVIHWDMKNVPIYVNQRIEGVFVIAKDVTDLIGSEARYQRLIELSPVAIAVYKDHKFTYINPAGAKMLGVEFKGQAIDLHIMDLIHPDYREHARRRIDNTLLNGYSPPTEYEIIRTDGQIIVVTMFSIFDSQSSSVQLMFEDITEKKQVEQALMESEELSRRLIEMSPEAIILHSDYRFIYVNLAGLELFGVSSQGELVGQPIFKYIHPDYRELVKERLGETIYTEERSASLIEEKLIRSDGEWIDVEVVTSTILYKGKHAGISMFRDIRDRKKADEERRRTEQVIRESEERYYRLQTSLDQFSHDLFGMMKTSHMKQRLLAEVRNILWIPNATIMEAEYNHDKLCEIIENDSGFSLKIGEVRGKSYLLHIPGKPPALRITAIRVWLKTITRYVSVLFDNFLLIEDLTEELEQVVSGQVTPTWLLRFMFNLSEKERKRLAQDLHDSALQEQIIWFRKLELLLSDTSVTGEVREQLEQISEGLLDVIYQLRVTCNELRPPLLIRDGLVPSLEALFEITQMRANYRIHFDSEHFHHKLNNDILIGVYRIVQELLANATKHSSATEVRILLSSGGERTRLEYKDNGIGMDLAKMEDSYTSMGIYGMKERVRSMDGTIQFLSSRNEGLSIYISIPGCS
ncbi:PAS domain S-box protein [Paenibacillus lentus]|uniref:sensor histidine kinase n=1 Tax=Paenibacillus lentus TaxID=1338368 RepID=UPI00365CB935